MKQILVLLSLTLLFACSKPAHETLFPATNKAAADRSALVAWTLPDATFTTGQTVEAKFSVSGFDDLTAFQFAMQFDTATLGYQNITFTGAIPYFNLDCIGMEWMGYFLEPGEVRVAWVHYAAGGLSIPAGTECFSLFFTAKKAGTLAAAFPHWPGNPILPSEASDGDFNIIPLTVSYIPIAPPINPPGGNNGNPKKKKKRN